MIIDTDLIKKAIFDGSAVEAAELCNIPAQTIRQYRSNKQSNSYRDWEKISLIKAKEIMNNIESKNSNL
ncbi:hypothetical protein [Enterococcus alishanensis]